MRNDFSDILQRLLNDGYCAEIVFDVGANQGQWTAKYSQQLPSSRFFLFEANPKRLRPSNLAPKHKWFNIALSSLTKPEVSFYNNMGTGDSYYKEQTAVYEFCQPTILKTSTLDDTVVSYSLPYPNILKLDTQGSELDIIEGGQVTLSYADIVVVEVSLVQYNIGAPLIDDYMKTFKSLNFVPVGINEIHFVDNILVQLDVVFLRKSIKTKYFGDTGFIQT